MYDMDGDGKLDMLYRGSSTVSVRRNISLTGTISPSSFAASVDFEVYPYLTELAVGDLDGDGKPEIIASSIASKYIFVLHNTSTPGSIAASSFAGKVDISDPSFSSAFPSGIRLSDIDGDGKPEILFGGSDHINILQNNTPVGAIIPSSFAITNQLGGQQNGEKRLSSFYLGDLDGDGKPDIVANVVTGDYIAVYRNTATPGTLNSTSFADRVDISVTQDTRTVIGVEDIDGDGRPDIVGYGSYPYYFSVRRNISTPGNITVASFENRVDYTTGNNSPNGITIADADGDSKPDLLFTTSSGTLSFLRNTAVVGTVNETSFTQGPEIVVNRTSSPVVGDLDGDGTPELSFTSSNSISIFKKLSPQSTSPLINSFSPTSGVPGTNVVITGINFDANSANNIVYFGAVRAVVKTASTTSLTVIAPAGTTYKPISVINTSTGLTAYSSKPFIITFKSPFGQSIPPGFYLPKVDFGTGPSPSGVTIADLDGDGKSDLVTVNESAGTLSVLRNTAATGNITTASFAEKVDISTGSSPRSVAVSDLDGDGKPDIIVANAGSNTVSVLRNISTAGNITNACFEARIDFATGTNPRFVVISDADGDGRPDIAVANYGSNSISVLRNVSVAGSINAASFEAKVDFSTGSSPVSLAFGDVNADGKPDLVVANEASNTVSVLQNRAGPGSLTSSSFAGSVEFAANNNPQYILISDVDDDNRADIAVGYATSNAISLLRNTSVTPNINALSFTDKADFAVGTGPHSMDAGDVDGNGKVDLVVANYGSGTISVLQNTTPGNGTSTFFSNKTDFVIGNPVTAVTIGDLDGDGIPEIATARNPGNVSILRISASAVQPPLVVSLEPGSAPINSVVTITGANFDAQAGNNLVFFGAVRAAVNSASATQLTVTVPAGAAYGQVSVLNLSNHLTGYSPKPFIPLFANPFGTGIPQNFYNSSVSLPVSRPTRSFSVGDIDGDGKPDLATVGGNNAIVSVLRNISSTGKIDSSSFTLGTDLIATGSIVLYDEVKLADLDGDGKPDLIASNSFSHTISLFRNTSAPGSIDASSFANRIDFAISTGGPSDVIIRDMDGDGKPDMLFNAGNAIAIMRNTSNPGIISFTPRVNVLTGKGGNSLACNDLDGDGKPDLLVTGGPILTIVRNSSVPGDITDASFEAPVDFELSYDKIKYPFGFGFGNIQVADIDGDGKPDITLNGPSFSVLRNTATTGTITASSFAAQVDLPVGGKLIDVDGDGKPDLVSSGSIVTVNRNVSTPGSITASSFTARSTFPLDRAGFTFSVAGGSDLDGDGLAELIVGVSGSSGSMPNGGISILKINSPPSSTAPPIIIAALTPSGAPVGAPVSIRGKGFQAAAANNIVYFGAVRAAVTRGSDTSLTVTVPVGATYQPVSVLNTMTHLIAYSPAPFAPLFTNPFGTGVPPNYYLPRLSFPTVNPGSSLAVADIDIDGKPDLLTGSNNGVYVLRNTSSGALSPSSFTGAFLLPLSSTPINAIAVGDLDGDGRPNVVAVLTSANTISVYRNNGNADPALIISVGDGPRAVAIDDIDRDGKPDIVVANSSSNTVSVLRNTSIPGSISFAARVDYPVGSSPYWVAIGDLDGDGLPDIATANFSSGTLSVLRHTEVVGSEITLATFAPKVDFATAPGPVWVAISDINGDGKPDLVAVNNNSAGAVSVLQNAATLSINNDSFLPRVDFPVPAYKVSAAIADVDGDGKPDIIAGTGGSVTFLRNTGATGIISAASFAPTLDFDAGNTRALAAADVDGDGIPEIISANSAAEVSVLKVAMPVDAAVPQISSFSPASGPVGTTVTITGSHFNASAAKNLVFFGAAKAVVTGGSSTSLTVKVPTGTTYQPITVFNPVKGLTAYSSRPFTTTFNNPFGSGIPASFYLPKLDFSTEALPYMVTLSDLNGDSRPEMIVVNAKTNTLSVIRIRGVGAYMSVASFSQDSGIPTGTDPRAVAAGDLDGDGMPDVVVANAADATVSVLRNRTFQFGTEFYSPNFAPKIDFPTGSQPFSVAIGDVDGDGKPDIVVANLTAGTVSVLRNTSAIGSIYASSFAPKVDYPVGTYPRSVTVSDLDGDGKPEISVVNERSNTVSVLHNTSIPGYVDASSFAPMVGFATGSSPDCLAVNDLDGDGRNELVVSNYGSNTVSVLYNQAAAGIINASTFAGKIDFATGNQPFFVTTGDADGDGKPDIIVSNSASSSVSVLRNISVTGGIDASSFAPGVEFGVSGYPVSVIMGDLDANGTAELAVTNAATNSISVLIINIPPPPVITSVTPASSPAGAVVTITGANFNDQPSANTVYFGAVKATITAGTSTSLTTTVPAGATYQPLSVLNNPAGLAGYSPLPFTATFPNPFGTGIPANFYSPKVDFTSGSLPFYTAIGDLDGDGKPDLVVANSGSGTVSVLRNTSDTGSLDAASFSSKTDFATASDPRSLVLSDVDGDGRLDIVVACASSYTITVLHNAATPGSIDIASFTGRTDIPTTVYISAIAAGDLDSDGKPELVAANLYSNGLSVLKNTSTKGSNTASFAALVNLPAGAYPRSLALSDIDGDGKPDIIVANEHSSSVTVLRNRSVYGTLNQGSFEQPVSFDVGPNPPSVAAGDVDGDGKPDLIVANYGSNTVSVLRNTATAGSINGTSFAARVDFATGSNPFFAALGDADGDGKPDILVANANSNINTFTNTVSVLRNTAIAGSINGTSFAGKADFATGGYPDCIALGDLDGDGVAELAVANAAIGGVSVFKLSSPAVVTDGVVSSAGAVQGIQTYPNPTQGAFTLQLRDNKARVASVEVLRENGTVVEKITVNTRGKTTALTLRFNLLSQPAGIYYVKVTGMDGVQVMKVVVQR